MKKLAIVLSVALLTAGIDGLFGQEDKQAIGPAPDEIKVIQTAIELSRLQIKNGLAYLEDAETPYTGWIKKTSANGKVYDLIQIKDGKRDGKSLEWFHHNGRRAIESTYKNGKLHGPKTRWNDNGKKLEKIIYEDGKQHGSLEVWHENGQKAQEGVYKYDKIDGLWTAWYKNGQLNVVFRYHDGKLNTATTYKPDGKLCPLTKVVDGNGLIVHYNDDGMEVVRSIIRNGRPLPSSAPEPMEVEKLKAEISELDAVMGDLRKVLKANPSIAAVIQPQLTAREAKRAELAAKLAELIEP